MPDIQAEARLQGAIRLDVSKGCFAAQKLCTKRSSRAARGVGENRDPSWNPTAVSAAVSATVSTAVSALGFVSRFVAFGCVLFVGKRLMVCVCACDAPRVSLFGGIGFLLGRLSVGCVCEPTTLEAQPRKNQPKTTGPKQHNQRGWSVVVFLVDSTHTDSFSLRRLRGQMPNTCSAQFLNRGFLCSLRAQEIHCFNEIVRHAWLDAAKWSYHAKNLGEASRKVQGLWQRLVFGRV